MFSTPDPSVRRAFTLIELVVATGIFVLGFASVYTLYALGMKYRQDAENLTRVSLAMTSILDEIKLDTGLDKANDLPRPPSAYLGDGFAKAPRGGRDQTTATDRLYPYRPMPGTWYVVSQCTDLAGNDDALTSTLHLTLVIVPFATTGTTPLDLGSGGEVRRRYGISRREVDERRTLLGGNASESDAVLDILVGRGLAFRYQAAVLRRASWLPQL